MVNGYVENGMVIPSSIYDPRKYQIVEDDVDEIEAYKLKRDMLLERRTDIEQKRRDGNK